MSRFASRFAVPALVVALTTPASIAFAAPASDNPANPGAPKSAAPAPETIIRPILVIDATLVAASARLAASSVMVEQTNIPGRINAPRPVAKKIRRQGAGGTVMMLVSTVAGIAGTVYMLKYFKDQQKDTDTGRFGR